MRMSIPISRSLSSPYVCSITVAIVLICSIDIAYASDFWTVKEFVTQNIKASIIEDDFSHIGEYKDSDELVINTQSFF